MLFDFSQTTKNAFLTANVFDILFSFILGYIFIRKLFKIIQSHIEQSIMEKSAIERSRSISTTPPDLTSIPSNTSNQCQNAANTDFVKFLIIGMTKNTILVVTALISTSLILIMSAIIMASDWDSDAKATFWLQTGIIIDNLINVTCLYLQYPFSNGLYRRFCGCCNNKCKELCNNMMMIFASKTEMEMVENMDISKSSPQNV